MIDITSQDLDILQTLTRRVRLLSADQARRIWWPRQVTGHYAHRRLCQLAEARFVEIWIVNVHVSPTVRSPLAAWRPGRPTPDPLAVSEAARDRWLGAALPTQLYTASRRTANLFGSTAVGLPELNLRDHCLLLAEVYATYRARRPKLAQRWLGEAALTTDEYPINSPVAFLVDDRGEPACVIKSAGRHVPRQIEKFHTNCAEHDLPYELW